jgi:hypothetical protein
MIEGELPALVALTDKQITAIWKRSSEIKKWLADIDSLVEERALAGKPLPETKIVAGRGSRSWKKDIEESELLNAVEGALGDEFDVDMLYETKLRTPAAVEKDIGGIAYKSISHLVHESTGKPAVVHVSDKRPAIEITSAKDAFKIEDEKAPSWD